MIVGFGILLALLMLSGALSLYNIGQIGGQVELYGKYTLPNNTTLWSVRRYFTSAQRYVGLAFIETEPQKVSEMLANAETEGKAALAALDQYAANQRNTDRDAQIKEVRDKVVQMGGIRRQIAELLQRPTQSSMKEAHNLFSEQYIAGLDEVENVLLSFSNTADARAAQQRQDAQTDQTVAWVSVIAFSAVSLVFSVVVVIFIRRSILKPVKEIERVYGEMAKGNLQVVINYESRDELGRMVKLMQQTNQMQSTVLGDVTDKLTRVSEGDMCVCVDIDYPGDFNMLKQAIEATVSALNGTLHNIHTAAEQVSIGSEQVSSGAQELAAGSTEQASSVEQLSASVSKIAEQAEENSSNVKIATQYVEEAAAGISTGNEHMEKLTHAMQNIDSASVQIANITKVIEDIAFQTNILALNAAIEAARAGTAGKGFAVVADEVRNLAAKSAEAAKQTGELIQHSTATVAEGSRITARTAEILHEVREKALQTSASIVKIERASSEQAAAIEQIKLGLSQVSAVVQTNAATAEENSATSEEMSAQASALRQEVARFRLDGGARGAQEPERYEPPVAREVISAAGKY